MNGQSLEPATLSTADREAAIVSRLINRDRRTFEDLYADYRPRLSRFLTNLIHRPPLVEEALNDTMMAVWTGLEGFKGNSKLSTWIFAIAYRQGMKALRRSDDPVEAKEDVDNADQSPRPDAFADRSSTQKALRAAMAQLSADHRAVVDLTYYHELGYREIAEIMECPVDTVKTRMFHARKHLKAILAGDRSDWL